MKNASEIIDEAERLAAGEDAPVWPPYTLETQVPLRGEEEALSIRVLRAVLYLALLLLALPLLGVALRVATLLVAWGWRLV